MSATASSIRTLLRRSALVVLGLLGALTLVVIALVWLVASEPGAALAARAAERASEGRLAIAGVQGRLIGPLRIAELRAGELVARGIRLEWLPGRLLERELAVTALQADSVTLVSAPSDEPPRVPERLGLPIALRVDRLAVGRFALVSPGEAGRPGSALVELTAVEARVASDGRLHRIERLALAHALGAVEASGTLDAAPPHALSATLQFAGRREGREHRVHAEVGGTLERPALEARIAGYEAEGTLSAALTPFAKLPFARARVEASGVDPSVFADGVPAARLRVRADLEPMAGSGEAPGFGVTGPVEIANGAPGTIDAGRLPLVEARARLTWRDQALALEGLRLNLPGGGRASGSAGWRDGAAQARLEVRELDLKALHAKARPTRLAGILAAEGDAQTQTLSARLEDPRFSADFDAAVQERRLTVSRAVVRARGAAAELFASLGLDEPREFTLRGQLKSLDPAAFAEVPPATLNAQLDARGRLAPAPSGEVRFELGPGSRFRGEPLSGGGVVSLEPNGALRADVSVQHGPNRLAAKGGLGAPGERLDVDIDAPRLAALGAGVSGRARGRAVLRGTVELPSGEFEVEASALQASESPLIETLSGRGSLVPGEDPAIRLDARLGPVRASAGAQALIESAVVRLDGRRSRHQAQVEVALPQSRTLAAEAEGELSAERVWRGRLRALMLGGPAPWSAELLAPAALEVSEARVALGSARLRTAFGELRHEATEWTRSEWSSRGSLDGLVLRLTAEGLRLDEGRESSLRMKGAWDVRVGEQISGGVRLERAGGDLAAPSEPPLALGLDEVRLEAAAAGERLEARLIARGGVLGRVSARASVAPSRTEGGWTLARDTPLEGELAADVPSLAWLGPMLGAAGIQTEGSLRAEAKLAGAVAAPRLVGTLRGDALGVRAVDPGVRLADGRLDVAFDDQRLVLRELSFVARKGASPRTRRFETGPLHEPPGRLRAEGELVFADESADLRVTAERVPVLQRPEQWAMVSGQAGLRFREGKLQLAGRIGADAGYWELPPADRPRLGDDVVIKGRAERKPRGFPISLDLEADLGERFFLQGRGLETQLVGRVRLRAEQGGTLRANGSISTRGGTYDAFGIALALDRGTVNFQGPLDNPGLNIVALREGLPVEAGVAVGGTVLAPRVRLVSTPEVPDVEKLSWIVLGRAREQTEGGVDTTLLLTAARAIYGTRGDGGGGGLGQITRALGFDEVGIASGRPGGSESHLPAETVAGRLARDEAAGTGSQVLTVGRRLSSTAYLGIEQSLTDLGTVVKLTVQLHRRLSVIARAGTENALDLFYTFAFD